MLFNLLTNQEKINSGLFWFVMGIGFIGTGIAIIAFLPQSLKTIKSKKTNGVSVLTFSFYTLANTLWFIWGILDLSFNSHNDLITILKDVIVIVANLPCAIWAGIILGIKIYNIYHYGEDCKKWKGKKNNSDNIKNKTVLNQITEKQN
ncbi:MAG: PQ-loop domain-containing transporter [Spiroplasma sp.]|nr:PQ-loop domain-containing transporter [Spiroplasma sp.]